MITIDSGQQVCPHQLQFKTGDTFNGKELYYLSLSGVFIVNFSGSESSRNVWHRDKVVMHIPVTVLNFPAVSEIHPYWEMGFSYVPSFILKHWTIYVNQNSFGNNQIAVNDGHAVNSFGIQIDSGRIAEVLKVRPTPIFSAEAILGIRDIDSTTYRIGYHIELLGYFGKGEIWEHPQTI